MPKTPEIIGTHAESGRDASGRFCTYTVTVYAPARVRREVQPIRKAGMRTSGRKTRASARLGCGSLKGVGMRNRDLGAC